jgi:hypothetical protein
MLLEGIGPGQSPDLTTHDDLAVSAKADEVEDILPMSIPITAKSAGSVCEVWSMRLLRPRGQSAAYAAGRAARPSH